jgi:hypothetical protein
MRKATIALNSIVIVFFGGFLAYTFFARQHVEGLARAFVTERTLQYSAPIVTMADESLGTPIVQKRLSAQQSAAIRHEINEYRKDAAGYVADLTRQRLLPPKPANPNLVLARIASIKERIRTFYDNTLAALIADLRIFSSSNLSAGLIALWLTYRSREGVRKPLVWFSLLMFVAVLNCSYVYLDDLTFFRILFRTHMGWWYPAFLCVVLAGLYLEYGRAGHTTGKTPGDLDGGSHCVP